ncbi:hypothetical protein GQ457_11G002380 [Hibiscus cannabinus]
MAPTLSGVGNPVTTLSSLFPCPRLSSLFLPGLRSFMEEPFLYSREFQSPGALWSNFRRFREIEGWGCRPEAGFSEGDGATVISALGKGVGRATFLCARSWLSRPFCKIQPYLEFPIPPYLSCKLRPPLKPPFSSFCSLAKFPLAWWMAFLFLFLPGNYCSTSTFCFCGISQVLGCWCCGVEIPLVFYGSFNVLEGRSFQKCTHRLLESRIFDDQTRFGIRKESLSPFGALS